jgi:hypothetical protein
LLGPEIALDRVHERALWTAGHRKAVVRRHPALANGVAGRAA